KVRGMLPRTALSLHKCRVGAKAHTARQARAREPGGARPPRRIVARLRNARTARESVDSFLPGRRDPLTETIPWALPSPEVVMPRPLVFAAILFTLGVPATSWAAAPGAEVDRPRPLTPAIVDNSQRIDVNRIGMFVTNTGSFAWDKTTLVAGLEFPRGSGKTAVFAAGPWIGAMVGGETRVALSEYSDEYGPGSMIGGAPDDPSRPEYKVYKLNRVYSS